MVAGGLSGERRCSEGGGLRQSGPDGRVQQLALLRLGQHHQRADPGGGRHKLLPHPDGGGDGLPGPGGLQQGWSQ